MAEQKEGIITMFLTVLIALAFILSMASLISERTELSASTNESINISSAIIDDDNINESIVFTLDYGSATTGNTPISGLTITNGTDTATITTDYLVGTDLGNLTLKNSTYMLNAGDTLYATYNYKPLTYMDNSFARLITALIIGFAALVILAYLISRMIGIFSGE